MSDSPESGKDSLESGKDSLESSNDSLESGSDSLQSGEDSVQSAISITHKYSVIFTVIPRNAFQHIQTSPATNILLSGNSSEWVSGSV